MPFTNETGKLYAQLRAKDAANQQKNYQNLAQNMHQAVRIQKLQEQVKEASERNDEEEPPVIDQFAANTEIQVLQEQDKNVFTQKRLIQSQCKQGVQLLQNSILKIQRILKGRAILGQQPRYKKLTRSLLSPQNRSSIQRII
ncbi:Hypothetical_protein [Hexamita inflata]|uniref:Hypothetical_protein n=1 Tax=Hexamita inflata TaxID=28002 RepID=A0ABP1GRN5_9EUKA